MEDVGGKIRRLPNTLITLKRAVNREVSHLHNFPHRFKSQIILTLKQDVSFPHLLVNDIQGQVLNEVMLLIKKDRVVEEYLFEAVAHLLG